MDRRRILQGAAVGVAGALAAPAVARAERVLKLVGAFPRGLPGVGVNAERLAERITALSDGRLNVKYFGGGELVPPFAVNDAVGTGAADLGHTASYFAAGKIRSAMYFTTFPYGLSAAELSGWIRFGGGQQLWDAAYAEHGLKPFYAGNSGTQAGGWFRKEINSMEDLVGLKMRIAGLGGDVMKKIGVTTVNTPPGEIFTSLQTGVVDAAEFVGPWNDIALGLYKVAPHYYMPAFHEPGPGLECIVNLDLWDDLSEADRVVIKAAADATADETTADYAYHNVRTLTDMVEKFGVTVGAFPDDVVAALGEAAKEAIAEYPKGDTFSEQVHEAYFEYVRQCAAYGAAMEGRMYAERAAVWGV